MRKIFLAFMITLISVAAISQTRTWTGNAGNSVWNIPTNWSPPGPITTATSIIIPSGCTYWPNMGTDKTVKNVTVNSGGIFDVTHALTITGLLVNNGTMTVRENPTAGIITNTTMAQGSVEITLGENRWHYVSPSVTNATANVFNGDYLKYWDEPQDEFLYITSPTVTLTSGQGYSVWVPGTYGNTSTRTFTGWLGTGDVDMALTSRDPVTGEDNGWNLVGNPYPCNIDWNSTGWDKSDIDEGIYFWQDNEGVQNYHYYLPSGGSGVSELFIGDATNIIPPAQGFFVHCIDDGATGETTGTLQISNSCKTAASSGWEFHKSTKGVAAEIGFRVKVGDDELVFRKISGTTSGFDSGYDLFQFNGYGSTDAWIDEGTFHAVANSYPTMSDGSTYDVSFAHNDIENTTFYVSLLDNTITGHSIYVTDNKTSTVTKLNAFSSYSFTSEEEDDLDRFEFEVKIDKPEGKSMGINTSTEFGEVVKVYNLLGEYIGEEIPQSEETSIYILKDENGNTKKIVR